MSTIVGAVLSVAVIAGSVALIREIRAWLRYHDTEAKMTKLRAQHWQSALGASKLTVIAGVRRRFQVRRPALIAGAGLLGSVGTAATLLMFFHPTTPAAGGPSAAGNPSTTAETVTATVTQGGGPQGTITRVANGTVTVIPGNALAATASVAAPTPVPVKSPADPSRPHPSATAARRDNDPAGPATVLPTAALATVTSTPRVSAAGEPSVLDGPPTTASASGVSPPSTP